MLARCPPTILARVWFPLGEQRKTATRERGARGRAWQRPGGPRARRCASSAAATTATFLERHGGAGPAGEIVDEAGARARPPRRRRTGFTAGPAPRHRRRRRPGALRAAHRGRHRPRGRRRPRAARGAPRAGQPGRGVRPGRARRRARCATAARAVPARVVPSADGFELELDEPALGVAAGQAAVLYDGDTVVGAAGSPRPAPL